MAEPSDESLLQAFATVRTLGLSTNDKDDVAVTEAVMLRWLEKRAPRFRVEGPRAMYYLAEWHAFEDRLAAARALYERLQQETVNGNLGERAYALAAMLRLAVLNKTGERGRRAGEMVKRVRARFGADTSKVAYLVTALDVGVMSFLHGADDKTITAFIDTSVPEVFRHHLASTEAWNRHHTEFNALFKSSTDPVTRQIYLLREADQAELTWSMNHDLRGAIRLKQRFIAAYRDEPDWRVQEAVNELISKYAMLACGPDGDEADREQARAWLQDLSVRMADYRGSFLRHAQQTVILGLDHCRAPAKTR